LLFCLCCCENCFQNEEWVVFELFGTWQYIHSLKKLSSVRVGSLRLRRLIVSFSFGFIFWCFKWYVCGSNEKYCTRVWGKDKCDNREREWVNVLKCGDVSSRKNGVIGVFHMIAHIPHILKPNLTFVCH
jgi:hypothetical protein